MTRSGLAATLAALAASLAPARSVDACTISPDPSAYVFQSPKGDPIGHRPWIVLRNIKGAVKVTTVAASCAKDKVCKGKDVAVERVGSYLRPKAALASSSRLQVTSGKKLLADVTIGKDAKDLPAWDGVTLVSSGQETEGLCSPAGPAVHLALKPTRASLDGAVLLVYLKAPDPKRPETNLAQILNIVGTDELVLRNPLGAPAWLEAVPKQLWVALSDGDGHVGPAIALP